jgi:hypothetical protein
MHFISASVLKMEADGANADGMSDVKHKKLTAITSK